MPDARSASPEIVLNLTLIVPFEKLSTPRSTATGKYANCFALSMSSSLLVPYSLRALSMSSFVGLSLLATHGRPSTMIAFSPPSCTTTQVPTIGSKVAGGRRAAHLAPPTELVPDLAVVRARLLEQPDRRRRDVSHLDARHHPTELRDRLVVEIDAAGILRRQMRFDAQRPCDARERRLVR